MLKLMESPSCRSSCKINETAPPSMPAELFTNVVFEIVSALAGMVPRRAAKAPPLRGAVLVMKWQESMAIVTFSMGLARSLPFADPAHNTAPPRFVNAVLFSNTEFRIENQEDERESSSESNLVACLLCCNQSAPSHMEHPKVLLRLSATRNPVCKTQAPPLFAWLLLNFAEVSVQEEFSSAVAPMKTAPPALPAEFSKKTPLQRSVKLVMGLLKKINTAPPEPAAIFLRRSRASNVKCEFSIT